MSKIRRVANAKHASTCTFIMEDACIRHICHEDCQVSKFGGVSVVMDAMDKIDSKISNRKYRQKRKKKRGW